MAATFSFSTTPILSGHSIRIYNTSLNWDQYVPGDATTVTLTVTAVDGDLIFTGGTSATFTKTYTPAELVGDFILDLTSLEMYGTDEIVPDDILNFKIDIAGSTAYTYNTDEVFYYNAWKYKSEVCYTAVNYIDNVNGFEIRYACMVNILYQGLISDIAVANTTGIYEKINLFTRLALQSA